ncbi:MAG: efflux RND transporter periplasmic adaptor subunit [Desulfobacterales bacterium]|nr:efflux RND transporter periplasmic adaptor subunit [Desulfobacterales bacterium]
MKKTLIILLLVLFTPFCCLAQEKKKDAPAKKKGRPPSPVVVTEITSGEFEPRAEFVGTIFYSHVSRVAAEIEGLVIETYYEEGEMVRAGQKLVRLNSDMLDARIDGTKALYEEAMVSLEKAKKDFERMDSLFKEESISEVILDEHFFKKKGNEKKSIALRATLEQMLLRKKKKVIKAPFDGVVIEKSVEKGEWIPPGGVAAVIAYNRDVDIVVDVPEYVLRHLEKGSMVDVSYNGSREKARFINVVPRGDIATRTFSIKLRLPNTAGLIEGMEARAHLPVAARTDGLLAPRDAVMNKYGKDVVFTVADSSAKMTPIKVKGYIGLMAGIEGPGLSPGMKIVIKGNERIRNGQPVRIVEQ